MIKLCLLPSPEQFLEQMGGLIIARDLLMYREFEHGDPDDPEKPTDAEWAEVNERHRKLLEYYESAYMYAEVDRDE